ncbi:MAG: CBS domain-containing protein [Nocardioides sp.]
MDERQPAQVRVGEVMSRRIVAIRSDCALSVAVDTFVRTSLRHLVVVDPDRRVRGLISAEQTLAALGVSGTTRRVADHVSARPPVHHQDTVRRAAQVMLDELVDALPVVDDDGRVVGVLTWSDIVATVAGTHLAPTPRP